MTSGRGKKGTAGPPAGPGGVLDGTVPKDEQGLREEQELQEEIEQTREQLGETVEELVAKADLKGRARAKAADLTRRVKGRTARVRAKATERGTGVRSHVAAKSVGVRHQAQEASGAAKARLQARGAPVWEAVPGPVRRTAVKGASAAQRRRVPLMVAAATLVAGYVVLRWWGKR